MINPFAFNKAVSLHHQIVDHIPTAFLVAKTDTPISALVAPVIAPALFYSEDSEDHKSVSTIAALLERNTVVTEGVDTHAMALRNFVELSAEAVRSTVYLTRSVALPVIDNIVNGAESRYNEVSGGVGLALNILVDTQSTILEHPTLVSAVSNFQNVAGPNAETVNVHDPRSSEQLLEIMRVGYDDFDKEMEAWMAAHLGADIVSNVYHRVFSSASTTTYIGNVFNGTPNSYPEALICFLLCRGLSLNPDDSINMTAGAYDSAMAYISNYSANVIIAGMQNHQNADKYDRVVLRFPPPGQEYSYDKPEQGVIVVNKTSYERYLSEGGSPESIMGSYLTDRETDASKLTANREDYVKVYNSRVMKARSDKTLNVLISMRKFIESAVSQEIVNASTDNEDSGLWKGIKINPESAQRILRQEIDVIRTEHLDNVYKVVRDIVLNVFFADTDVIKLIDLIDSNSKGYPEDLKSAVNVAIIDYIVDWYMHQTTLCKG